MRALSLPQPWASLAVSGQVAWIARPHQTRHRGPLAIHARRVPGVLPAEPRWHLPGPLPAGAVVGVVTVVDCRPIDLIPPGELADCPYPAEPGWWAWEIRGATLVDPFPCQGARGLFHVEFAA